MPSLARQSPHVLGDRRPEAWKSPVLCLKQGSSHHPPQPPAEGQFPAALQPPIFLLTPAPPRLPTMCPPAHFPGGCFLGLQESQLPPDLPIPPGAGLHPSLGPSPESFLHSPLVLGPGLSVLPTAAQPQKPLVSAPGPSVLPLSPGLMQGGEIASAGTVCPAWARPPPGLVPDSWGRRESRTHQGAERGRARSLSREEGTALPPPARPHAPRPPAPKAPRAHPSSSGRTGAQCPPFQHQPAPLPPADLTALQIPPPPFTRSNITNQSPRHPACPSARLSVTFCHPGSTCPVSFPPFSPQGTARGHPPPFPSLKTHSHGSAHSCPAFITRIPAYTPRGAHAQTTQRTQPSLSTLSPAGHLSSAPAVTQPLGFWTRQPPPPPPP